MAPEDSARGARGGAQRARGYRPRRGNSARGGRGGAAAAAPSNENATPDVEMGDATAAPAAPAASADVPIKSEGDAAGAPSNPQPAGTTPSSSATRPAAARPTPTRGGASGAAKFLPRAIRRSQLDREAIAQKESQKQEDKAAQDARLRRAGRGGRGGGRRARGGPGGFQDRVIKGGAGGFASQLESSGSRGGSSGGFGKLYDYGSAGGSGGGGGGGGGGSGGWSVGVKSEGGPKAFSSESSRPTGRRMNTDKIVEYVVIEDNDDQVKSKEGTPVLLPKGMQREDPKEPEGPEIATAEEVEAADRGETVIPISSGSSEEDDEDVFFNDADVEMGDDGRQWPGAKADRRVKVEGEEVTEIDTLTKKKAAKKAEQKAKRLQTKYKDPEDQLAADTLAFQRRLFGVESDDESDAEAPDTAEAKVPRKPAIIDGNLYLFQFPPVLPPLHIAEKTQKSQGPVKDEPTDDMVILDAPAHRESKPVDLTAADDSAATVKKEDGAADAENARGQAEEQPEGFLGKLIVRKSGKMQIDYGGFLFDCESGIPVEFLRTAVLTEMDDEKKPDGYAGTAYGMGQISGKFVSVPKWSDEEEWVVDPSELPPNGAASG